jgi:group I intron endonuclease
VTGTGGVYVIQSPSGKYRVGLTRNFDERFRQYRAASRSGRSENQHWIRAIQKYGWSSMRISTLPLPPEEWEETERLFIWLLRADHKDFGYNKTSGGEKSKVYSPETKALMSSRRRGKGCGPSNTRKAIMKVVNTRPAKCASASAKMKLFFSDPINLAAHRAAARPGVKHNVSERGHAILTGPKSEAALANYRAAQRKRALQIAKYVMFNGVPTLLSDVGRALGISSSHAHYYFNRGRWPLATTPTDIQ